MSFISTREGAADEPYLLAVPFIQTFTSHGRGGAGQGSEAAEEGSFITGVLQRLGRGVIIASIDLL